MNEPAVAIGNLERFVADYERESGNIILPELAPKNGIKVAVVGSGPAGLSFAGDMVKYGYDVTVFEALHEIGGVLKYGIPEFRLPNKIVDVEINNLEKMGVKFVKDCVNLMDASNPETDTPINPAKRVMVVGGGNTAMDSCRTAKRLGAEKVYIVYRRSEAEMPARLEEVKHAKEEGIEFLTLHNPLEYIADESYRHARHRHGRRGRRRIAEPHRAQVRQRTGAGTQEHHRRQRADAEQHSHYLCRR